MPNQENFKTDIQSQSNVYTRYSVSRVIDNSLNNLLELEIPSDFNKFNITNVEMHVYSLYDNSLIYSTVVPYTLTGATFTQTFQYTQDSSQRTLLFIDFSTLVGYGFPTGQYSVSFNFFADEIGTYGNRLLKVSKISNSATELELEYIKPPTKDEQTTFSQFASPQINSIWIKDALRQIYNQPSSTESNIPTVNTSLSSSMVLNSLPTMIVTDANAGQFTNEILSIAQPILNSAYVSASLAVDTMLLAGQTRFTQDDLISITNAAIYSSFVTNTLHNQPAKFIIR